MRALLDRTMHDIRWAVWVAGLENDGVDRKIGDGGGGWCASKLVAR